MKTMTVQALALALALAAQGRAETLAKVGGEKIEREEFEAKASVEERNAGRKLSKEERVALLRSLANQRLLVAEAKAAKLDKDPGVKLAIEDAGRKILSDLVYAQAVASPAQQGLAEVEAAYKKDPKAFEGVLVSQILAGAQAGQEAAAKARAEGWKAALAKAPKGFAQLAAAESDDNVNKARGGEIGWVRRGTLVPELEKAVFGAKPGSVVGPVKTQFGYHVLQVRERRQPTLEQVKQDLVSGRSSQLQQKLLEDLAKKHKLRLEEDKL